MKSLVFGFRKKTSDAVYRAKDVRAGQQVNECTVF